MMKNLLTLLILFHFSLHIFAQQSEKKTMDENVYDLWNTIQSPKISNNGEWVIYSLKPGEGDNQLKIVNTKSRAEHTFDRSEGANITNDSRFVVFDIKPPADTVKAMERRKVKKKNMPKDTLGIYDLTTNVLEKIPDVKSYKLPKEGSGWLAFLREPQVFEKGDTTVVKPKKKETKDSGTRMTIKDLRNNKETTVEFVKDYVFSEKGKNLICSSTGNDTTFLPGIYLFEFQHKHLRPLYRGKGDFKYLTFDERGNQATFLADLDTTDARIRPFQLFYWKRPPADIPGSLDSAVMIANNKSGFLPEDWIISKDARPSFSENNFRLFFGIAPQPILQDTTLLKDEIVNVEVWSYTDGLLHTQQKVRLDQEKKRSYLVTYDLVGRTFQTLGDETVENVSTGNEGNADFALGYDQAPYLQTSSWEGGSSYRDLYTIDLRTGKKKMFAKMVKGSARLSPGGNYAYWYSSPDTAWYSYSIQNDRIYQITNNEISTFYDELNDRPMHPGSYSSAGWSTNDEYLLIYDRYDIWKIHPENKAKPTRLTKGRESKMLTTYRYVRLDPEERFIDLSKNLFLHLFQSKNKESGYARWNSKTGTPERVAGGKYSYSRRPQKAKDADVLLFTKENFNIFPDLMVVSDQNFKNERRISNANPQQSDYLWGTAELYEWTSLDGQKLQGLLYKPEGFDPNKKYPMLVNFYERSSNRLYSHHAPAPGRSTISYSFYINRGYLIFNPDVPYKIGYPGESAYDAVVSGVTSLIDEGFVDKDNIGAQGHSWGGYQIAHLVTKTNLFKCVESGAPVVNMISAYGGIRWGSGMSRMFQYEQTQSRIGGTLWEYPVRYIENSPIFFVDKIETPVLIMHNDNDSAVPWYQGIEFFVALRRLGKPVWMLNYNGEPHWAVKKQNRMDFNKRMQQFFDHYLKGTPKPLWMRQGVPAIEKGIKQGYELEMSERE